MICSMCGRKLKLIRPLSYKESNDLDYVSVKENTARQALSPEILNSLELGKEELYAYVRANTDALAEALFLSQEIVREIANSVGYKPNELSFSNGQISVHEVNNEDRKD